MPNRQLFMPSPHGSYVYDDYVFSAIQSALSTQRPLLVVGPPGSGKSSMGLDVANTLGWRYYEFVISSRTEPGDLCYRFDATRRLFDAQMAEDSIDVSRYVEPGVLWWAFDRKSAPIQDTTSNANREEEHAVVLLDELDSGSSDLDKSLIQVLEAQEFLIVESSTYVRARVPPFIIVTTNGERELSRRFVDRCFVVQLSAPTEDKLIKAAQMRFPSAEIAFLSSLARAFMDVYGSASTPVNMRDYFDVVVSCLNLNVKTFENSPIWQMLTHKLHNLSERTPSQVFVSYAWGDTSPIGSEEDRQRQEVVERLCQTLEKEHWQVVRDKTALQYGDKISTFMKTLSQANLVIVVLSAKYLRSPYCMKELHALYQNSRQEKRAFLDRIIPLVLDDARFGTPRERVECAKYWEAEYLKLKADLDYLAEDDFRLYQNMKKWYVDVGDMLSYVNDVLHPHGFENIEKDDFAALRQMLPQCR